MPEGAVLYELEISNRRGMVECGEKNSTPFSFVPESFGQAVPMA